VLIALTLAIHAAGVTFLVSVLHDIRFRLESRNIRLAHLRAVVIGTITAMGVLLATLHGIEAAFWAAAYLWLGALGSPEAAILYSVDAMATRGASSFR
jgi:membrane-associated PAP2 superfamily phosphatase